MNLAFSMFHINQDALISILINGNAGIFLQTDSLHRTNFDTGFTNLARRVDLNPPCLQAQSFKRAAADAGSALNTTLMIDNDPAHLLALHIFQRHQLFIKLMSICQIIISNPLDMMIAGRFEDSFDLRRRTG
ncbi:hypothetical protein SDC9_100689 [bioreactor metagenome]|uniref:Uncharacterized protein n=1 Tax=bioreactor metagenome TaxID=1076179 RepID=A0A645AL97_9ZZZZ